MRQIVKISLMIAVIVATSGVASAGTVTVTKQTHSVEGLTGVTADQTSNSIDYTLGTAYIAGDRITFTFPTDALVMNSVPSQINVPAVDSATPANAIAGLDLGLSDSSPSSVSYRVLTVSQPDNTPGPGGTLYTNLTTLGAQVTLGSIGYTAASVATGNVSVTVTSHDTGGDVIDSTGTLTAMVAEANTQFGTATVSPGFANIIDVNMARKAFTTVSDTLAWSVSTPDTTGWLNLANFNPSNNGTVVTLFGVPGKMYGLQADDFTSSAGTLLFDEGAASLTVSFDGQVNSGTITFTPPSGAAAVVLEAQLFSQNLDYYYTSAASVGRSSTIATGLAAGAWGLNGTTAIIPYIPYGVSFSQNIYISNIGAVSGDISAEAIDDAGNQYDLGVIGVAAGGRVTKLSKLIGDKLNQFGFSGAGKVALKIYVLAPQTDIYIHASYIIGGSERGYVEVEYVN